MATLRGREVRLQVLVEDYAGEDHRADDAWLPVMKDSVAKLHKRLGAERASDLQARLEGGDYTAVAEGLLEYYDALYDRHLGNKRWGRGCGVRFSILCRGAAAAGARYRGRGVKCEPCPRVVVTFCLFWLACKNIAALVNARFAFFLLYNDANAAKAFWRNRERKRRVGVALTSRVEKHAVVAKEEAEKPRAGKMVEVAAFGVGEVAAGRTGKHPHSLDADRLVADVLRTVAEFEEKEKEEELQAAARG